MIEPQQSASVDLLNFSSKSSGKTHALELTGTGGKSAKQSFSSQLSDARRSVDSEQSNAARTSAQSADQERSDEAGIEADSDSGSERSDKPHTEGRSREHNKATADQPNRNNEQSTEELEVKKHSFGSQTDVASGKPQPNGPHESATISISHLSALQIENLTALESDTASLQIPDEEGLPGAVGQALDSDNLVNAERVDSAQAAVIAAQNTGDSLKAASTSDPDSNTVIVVDGRNPSAQEIRPIPANGVLPGLTVKSSRIGLNTNDGAAAKASSSLEVEVGTGMSLANLSNRYRKLEGRTGTQLNPLNENPTPATAISKSDAAGNPVQLPVHAVQAKFISDDTDANSRVSIAASGKAQTLLTEADVPEVNAPSEALNDEMRNLKGKEYDLARQSNQMETGNTSAGREQLSLQRATNAHTYVTASASATAEPVQNSAGPSLENMFLSVASGIVTAPLQTRPLPDGGAMINAPLNVALLADNAGSDMASNIRWMSAEGVKNAVINVTPSGMGPISVQIGIEDDQMSVSIIAVQGSTREALDSMLPRLREQLLAQGHDSVRVDVSDGKSEHSKTGNGQQHTEDFSDAAANANTGEEDTFNQMSEIQNTEIDESMDEFLIQDIDGTHDWQPGKYDLYV